MQGQAGKPWIQDEIRLTVDFYFDIFDRTSRGEAVAKAAEFRGLSARLKVRTPGSVELKMCNISSVLIGLGWPHIPGLGPMPNIQRNLAKQVVAVMEKRLGLDAAALRLIRPNLPVGPVDIVLAPNIPRIVDVSTGIDLAAAAGVRRDYVALEAQNSALGLAGELAVLEFEERRLRTAGSAKLANRIEHVSKTRGDGLGYDVLSFEPNGREKYVEVKTTTGANSIPFFVSKRELSVSQAVPEEYCLARVYDFPRGPETGRKAGIYELRGALDQSCALGPESYKAVPLMN